MLSSAATFSFFLAIGSVRILCPLLHPYIDRWNAAGNSNRWSESYSATSPSCPVTTDERNNTFESRRRDADESSMGKGEATTAGKLRGHVENQPDLHVILAFSVCLITICFHLQNLLNVSVYTSNTVKVHTQDQEINSQSNKYLNPRSTCPRLNAPNQT